LDFAARDDCAEILDPKKANQSREGKFPPIGSRESWHYFARVLAERRREHLS